MKKVFLLGATGSIGESTLEVIRDYSDKLKLVGASAHSNEEGILSIGEEFNCKDIILTGRDYSDSDKITGLGMDSLLNAISLSDADVVVNGIAGSSGLLPSVTSIKSGKDLALANKETMVMAGPLINKLAKENNVRLLPVDSEHSALFHLLEDCKIEDIEEVILTASGGAFRDMPAEKLQNVTVKDALKHPTWDMGVKITIDSASMANKGLEVIEAAMLFGMKSEQIKVLIHPQSYVHSLIRKRDCSMYAQISAPDMKLPIQNAVFYPQIEPVLSTYLDLAGKSLTFDKPDFKKYRMLELAYKSLEQGLPYTIAYNAANEVLVDSFIKEDIKFTDIADITEQILKSPIDINPDTIDSILKIDSEIRIRTEQLIGKIL